MLFNNIVIHYTLMLAVLKILRMSQAFAKPISSSKLFCSHCMFYESEVPMQNLSAATQLSLDHMLACE